MAEPMTVRRLAAAVLALGALTALGGCSVAEGGFLTEVCGAEYTDFSVGFGEGSTYTACSVSGDAAQVTGTTADSIAFRFGPDTGALQIRLSALPLAFNPQPFTAEVLAAASRPEGSTLYRELTWGACGPECPDDLVDASAPLVADYSWLKMLDAVPGFDGRVTLGADALLTFRGASVDLLDLRWPPQADPYSFE